VNAPLNAAMTTPPILPDTITLQVNGVAHATTARTLAQWVDQQGLAHGALASAVNGTFIPRTQRAQCVLTDGDAVVTFQPIEGG
jgi:sulfur carrier protein